MYFFIHTTIYFTDKVKVSAYQTNKNHYCNQEEFNFVEKIITVTNTTSQNVKKYLKFFIQANKRL